MFRIIIILCGVLLAACSEKNPLTPLEEDYFHACQKGGLELAESWAKGIDGDIAGDEKATRLRKLRKNAADKCECEARGFADILTTQEYQALIESKEAWSDARAGKLKGGYTEAADWINDLTVSKIERMAAVESRCPQLLDGVGSGAVKK